MCMLKALHLKGNILNDYMKKLHKYTTQTRCMRHLLASNQFDSLQRWSINITKVKGQLLQKASGIY